MSDDGGVPTICFDYCFLRDHPGGESVPVLVGREKRTKMMLAHVVPFKGGGVDWLVGQMIRDFRKTGVHGKIVLKSDQENPILDMLNDVCKQRGKESDSAVTLVESSLKGESQSNGIAERVVQDLEEGVRTHKLDLEAKLKTTVRKSRPCISWMVENVADIINKFKIGHDGRTACERLKGKTYNKGVIHEFWSVILHWILEKPQGGMMMERWVQGVWLGKRFTTDEHVIGLENGKVVRTRNVRPKSLECGWKFDEIDKIKGQQWDPNVTLTYEKLAQERFPRIGDPTPAEEEYVHTPRSHMIKKADLTKAGGWTSGCRKCEAMKEGDQSRTNLAHSAECRARVAETLADDVEFRTKMKS